MREGEIAVIICRKPHIRRQYSELLQNFPRQHRPKVILIDQLATEKEFFTQRVYIIDEMSEVIPSITSQIVPELATLLKHGK